ncbi:MATE family efflux transporter [Alkalilacustris brevis]|uniref:MATE family efflux transporter n=1 Tax=Alkalilacustris brevis TaxID=2026338 RepID=UPI000E0D0215|nr:MATE family efflux transporter [Alkalilacustris brevis]
MAERAQSPIGPLTHRRVLNIAIPIVLANATVPILGAVDTGVVGQLGSAAAIGAVGIGAIVITSVYWIFAFLRMGTTGLVAQARGARDPAETGAILMRALMIAFVAGFTLILLQVPIIGGAFLMAPASAEVEDLARSYLTIRIWGAPATIGLFAVTGWLIATERTRAVLGLQLWINGLNITLDLWFVLGLGWGVPGVAIATLIAEISGLMIGLWLCRAAFAGNAWRDWPRVFDRARLKRMMRVNNDIMIRTILLKISFISFVFIAAGFGDVTLASNQVLLQFLHISSHALDGFAFAAEALVGQAAGARSVRSLRRAAWLSSLWGLVMAGGLSLAYLAGGPWVIDLMAKEPGVQAEARIFLPWVVAATMVSLPAYMLDGIFIGATETRAMRITMLIAAIAYGVTVMVLIPFVENYGLWAGVLVLNAVRAVGLGLYYPGLEHRIAHEEAHASRAGA